MQSPKFPREFEVSVRFSNIPRSSGIFVQGFWNSWKDSVDLQTCERFWMEKIWISDVCGWFWIKASDGCRKSRWQHVLTKGWRPTRSSRGHHELRITHTQNEPWGLDWWVSAAAPLKHTLSLTHTAVVLACLQHGLL